MSDPTKETTPTTGAEMVLAEPAEEPVRPTANEGYELAELGELGDLDASDLASLLMASAPEPAVVVPEVIVPEVIPPPWLVALAKPRPWWASVVSFRDDF